MRPAHPHLNVRKVVFLTTAPKVADKSLPSFPIRCPPSALCILPDSRRLQGTFFFRILASTERRLDPPGFDAPICILFFSPGRDRSLVPLVKGGWASICLGISLLIILPRYTLPHRRVASFHPNWKQGRIFFFSAAPLVFPLFLFSFPYHCRKCKISGLLFCLGAHFVQILEAPDFSPG